ncbi:MAG TPA: molecular chaperone DnaK, partial [bacterium]|nr:molecular chaperone DnaK [bacterium]
SATSYMSGGKATVIPSAEGENLVPSVVAVDDKGNELVGRPAKNQMVVNAENTIYSVKRLIGRRWDDSALEEDKKNLPFDMRESKSGGVEIKMGEKWYSPQEISAKILGKIKKDAESFLGEEIKEAVITVPAYFDDSQRKATKDAGKIAGFDVKRVVNEPTAAALAYGLDKKKDEIIAVYDLGGGTFDISILEIGEGVFEVLSTNGDTHLGGDDWDMRMIQKLTEEFKNNEGIDLNDDKTALQRLKEASEKAKIELSAKESTDINLPYITADSKGPKHFNRTITRSELEQWTSDLIEQSVEPCLKALKDAKKETKDIDEVILVGGMTRMPAVRAKVKEVFGKEPNMSINPDEAVGLGAAIQAGVLGGDVSDITLLDVTPLSLGLETLGGVTTKIIERNTTIPVEKKQVFSTAADNQTAVDIHILQGEREMASDNRSLGQFRLDGIAPAPRGVPQVEVSFAIDANGILNVKAVDKGTGKEQHITITASTGLSDDEIDKMVQDAAKHAKEDKEKREQAEIKNNAETMIFNTEKLLKDSTDKIDKKDKESAEKALKELKEVSAKDDAKLEDIKKKSEELEKIVQEISRKMYEKAAAEVAKEEKEGKKDDKGGDEKQSDKKEKKDDKGKGDEADNAQEGEVVE